jgi:hypothetical protein
MVTVAPEAKEVPYTVMSVPPVTGPVEGDTPETWAAVGVATCSVVFSPQEGNARKMTQARSMAARAARVVAKERIVV